MGYKYFVLSDSKGITYNFEIYVDAITKVSGYPDIDVSDNIV